MILEKIKLELKVLFRSKLDYKVLWYDYIINDEFELYKKSGFTYISYDFKRELIKKIKKCFEHCGTGTVIIDDFCIDSISNKKYVLHAEVIGNDNLIRKLKTEKLLIHI